MALAKHMHRYFWDIDTSKARPKDYPKFYIERVLEYGDKRAFAWLKYTFGVETIRKYVKSRRISPKSQNYWNLYFGK